MRLALALVLLSACGPALTMRRLSPPRGALGPGKTISLAVTGTNEVIAGTAERVDQAFRDAFTERLGALGYTLCPAEPCGDGVLEVIVEQAALTEGEEVAGSTPPAKRVSAELKTRLIFTQPGGTILYRRSLSLSKAAVGPLPDLAHRALRELAAAFAEQLSRQTPLVVVQLEGGGPLTAGLELIHEAEWKKANEYFTRLTREQPDLDGAWYDLGLVLEVQGDWPAALTAYREALKRAQKPHYERAATAAANTLTLE